MKEMQEDLKKRYSLSYVSPFSDIILSKHKIHLFYSDVLGVNYSVYTDGSLEHIDTWVDKKPWERDIFLKCCGKVKRFDFLLTDANFIMLEKHYDSRLERVLYVDFSMIDDINIDKIYNLSISEKQNIKIKRLEL